LPTWSPAIGYASASDRYSFQARGGALIAARGDQQGQYQQSAAQCLLTRDNTKELPALVRS